MKRRIEKLESLTAWKSLPDASEYVQVWAIDPDQDEADTFYETRNGERVVDPKLIKQLEEAYRKAFSKGEVNVSVSFEDYNETVENEVHR